MVLISSFNCQFFPVLYKPISAACLCKNLDSIKTPRYILYSELATCMISTFEFCRKYFEVLHVCQNVSHPLLVNHYSVNDFAAGLMELKMLSDNFECLLNAVLLNKCLHAKYTCPLPPPHTHDHNIHTLLLDCGKAPSMFRDSWTRLASL